MPHGILEVFFPYLVAIYLAQPAERVGLAQMTMLLPGLGLLLVAGVIADRIDRRRMLVILQVINIVPVSGLLVALWFGQLTYTVILIFALASGTATAFVQPALDAMLNRVSGSDIQRAVTTTVGLMYGMNLVGYLVASRVDQLGVTPILFFYLFIVGIGAWLCTRLPSAPPPSATPRRPPLIEIAEGIRVVLGSKRMLPPALMFAFGGLFLGGPYAVLVPLMLRDLYEGRASDIAFAFIAFIVGGAASTAGLVQTGGVNHPGRALVGGYLISGIALLIWSAHVPYWGFLIAITFWGFGGGICLSMGRTIMQETAPPSHRARAMSVYYLGGMGMAPLGSLATGYLVSATSLLRTSLVCALGTFAFCLLIVLCTSIWDGKTSTDKADADEQMP